MKVKKYWVTNETDIMRFNSVNMGVKQFDTREEAEKHIEGLNTHTKRHFWDPSINQTVEEIIHHVFSIKEVYVEES
jgi:hypothetical protein